MNQYDSNTQKVMNYLLDHNYSASHMSLHRVCYRKLRAHLLEADTVYSAGAAEHWLGAGRATWDKKRHHGFRHCILQLEDIYQCEAIRPEHLSPKHSAYAELKKPLRQELDSFLDCISESYSSSWRNAVRISCARFMMFLQENSLSSVIEISYQLIIRFHEEDFHSSWKMKDLYENHIRQFLRFYAERGSCRIGYALLLNKLLIHQVTFLKDYSADHIAELERLRQGSLTFPAEKFWEVCREFQDILINKYKYADTVRTNCRHTFTLLFLFLDMHGFGYTSAISWIWLDETRSLLGTNWKMSRRALKLFEQFTQEGDITPSVAYTYRPICFDRLPGWCRQPLAGFLDLKTRESMAKSTITMYRSACTRFCISLVNKGMSSFDELSPEHLKEFNLMDSHSTPEGKNAYNVRIKNFIAYLEEQDVLHTFMLYRALPSVFAPREKIVTTLTSDEINRIREYRDTGSLAMELRSTAVILLGLKMGLRASDIVNLRFSNIDWKKAIIRFVQEKTKTEVALPMPTEAGNAVYRYISEGRPNSTSPYIFIRHKAPYDKLDRGACRRSLMKALPERSVPRSGFHVTRKSFATSLLRSGVDVNAIIDSLGHRSSETVSKYLSLDEERMRTCPLSLSETGLTLKGGLVCDEEL